MGKATSKPRYKEGGARRDVPKEEVAAVRKGRPAMNPYITQLSLIVGDSRRVDHLGLVCNMHLKRIYDPVHMILAYPNTKFWTCPAAKARRYLTWLSKESPYRHAFITKPVKTGMERGYLMNLDCPSNLLMGALIGIRTPQEYGDSVEIWDALVRGGVPPSLAYLVAPNVRSTLSGYTILKSDHNHSAVSSMDWSKKAVINFCTKGVYLQPILSYREEQNYSRVTALFEELGACLSSLKLPLGKPRTVSLSWSRGRKVLRDRECLTLKALVKEVSTQLKTILPELYQGEAL